MTFDSERHRTLSADLLLGDEGASAVEWGILASSIAAAVVVTIGGLGQNLAAMYEQAAVIIGSFL